MHAGDVDENTDLNPQSALGIEHGGDGGGRGIVVGADDDFVVPLTR